MKKALIISLILFFGLSAGTKAYAITAVEYALLLAGISLSGTPAAEHLP